MVTENYKVKVQVEGKNQLRQLNDQTLGLKTSLGGLGTAAKLAGGAFAALGVGKAIKGFIDVGREVENLQLRFKFLFGSAEEGARAFDVLNDFAARVPFTLGEISAASGNLAVVTDNADELADILDIVGNVAAVTGIDFQTAGEQIQRAFSGGIGAADIFREKGVRAMLGFEVGAKVSIEETRKRFFEVFGRGGEFGNATAEFANTLDGAVSMISDKFRKFQVAVAEEFFPAVKDAIIEFDEALAENGESIEEYGKSLGTLLANLTKVLIGIAELGSKLSFLGMGVKDLTNKILLGSAEFFQLDHVVDLLRERFPELTDVIDDFAEQLFLTEMVLEEKNKALNGALDSTRRLEQEQKKLTKSTEEDTEATIENNKAVYGSISLMEEQAKKYLEISDAVGKLEEEYDPVVAAENLRIQQLDVLNKALEMGIITQKKYDKILGDIAKSSQEVVESYNPMIEGINLLEQSFDTFKQGVGDAFADAILGSKNFAEALRDVGRAIIKQLISGLIQIGLEVFVFDVLREKLKKIRDEQNQLNAALGVEVGLRTVLAFLTGGASIGIPGLAEGGPAKRNHPYIVGEEGPELFMPNVSGTVVPNDELSMMSSPGEGDVNINFNISTVDARGFDELLISRRGVITGIINEGLNRQGRRALA